MEQVDLSAPITPPAITHYRVTQLTLTYDPDAADQAHIRIELKGSDGAKRNFDYVGAEAATLILALNTANLALKSLNRRVMERLIADGKLAGTISGTP